MTPGQGPDVPSQPKLLRARAAKVRIAAASFLILVIGAWLAPRTRPTVLSSVPEERAAPLLEEQVHLRDAERIFRGVHEIAERVRGQSVAIPSGGPSPVTTADDFSIPPPAARPAGFGIYVSGRYVLTHGSALEGRSSVPLVDAERHTRDGHVVAYERSTGLALLDTAPFEPPGVEVSEFWPAKDAPGERPRAPMGGPLTAGMLAAGFGHWDGVDIAVPLFVTSVAGDEYAIGSFDQSLVPGMPVYTLEGELVAIAMGRDQRRAFPVREAVQRLVTRAASAHGGASLGVRLQSLTGPLSAAFGDRGALVSDVVAGGPADRAALRAGDVLLAIRDVDIESIDSATKAIDALEAGTRVRLRLQRNGRELTIDVTPGRPYELASLTTPPLVCSDAEPAARALFEQTLLHRAGIRGSACVLNINGRAVTTRAEADRLRRRARGPLVLWLYDHHARFFAAVEGDHE